MADDKKYYIDIHKKEEFDQHLNKGQLVVVDFYATWCAPCTTIAPVFNKLAGENPDVIFLKVDGDENSELTAEYNITAYPTFHFIKNGKKIAEVIGGDKIKLEETVKLHK